MADLAREDPLWSYYREMVRRLRGSAPRARKTLHEISAAAFTEIELEDGSRHALLGSEARDLASELPESLAKRIRVPIVVAKISGLPRYRLVECSHDVVEMLRILAGRGLISWDPEDPCDLPQEGVQTILKRYKTLFVISLIYEESRGGHEEWGG